MRRQLSLIADWPDITDTIPMKPMTAFPRLIIDNDAYDNNDATLVSSRLLPTIEQMMTVPDVTQMTQMTVE
jgi:hypothetical protein